MIWGKLLSDICRLRQQGLSLIHPVCCDLVENDDTLHAYNIHYHSHSPLDSRKALDGECKTLLVLGVYSPFGITLALYQCPNQSDYGQSEARLTQQAVTTAFLLQKQLYVYGRPVWRLFLKKEVN